MPGTPRFRCRVRNGSGLLGHLFCSWQIQVTLDFEFPPADAGRLIPMYLRLSHGTIDQAHGGNALPFSPASTSVLLSQTKQLANAIRSRDRLGMPQRAYYLEPWSAQIWPPLRCEVEEVAESLIAVV